MAMLVMVCIVIVPIFDVVIVAMFEIGGIDDSLLN